MASDIGRSSLRPVGRGTVLVYCRRRVVGEELLKLLLEDSHILMLLLKLCVTLVEATQYLVLLLHVALLIKESLESLVGFLLPLLILLKRISTYYEYQIVNKIRNHGIYFLISVILAGIFVHACPLEGGMIAE